MEVSTGSSCGDRGKREAHASGALRDCSSVDECHRGGKSEED